MSSLKNIRLFTTQVHPCSYLPGQQARTLFIDPELEVSRALHTQLSELGFRRSGSHIYRPHCEHCRGCIPCRIPVREFVPNKRFRRVLRKNADLRVARVSSIENDEFYGLYADYINTRHRDGDMFPASREQYDSFLASACETTAFYSMRAPDGTLVGVMVSDHLDNALSAVYTFYDLDAARRSLGNFAILWQVAEAARLDLPYLYLGYWIRECEKMNYKIQYRPLQMLVNGRWVTMK